MNLVKRLALYFKNRGGSAIQDDEGIELEGSYKRRFYNYAYNDIEIVRRGVDVLVDMASEVEINILGRINGAAPRYAVEGRPTFVRKNVLDRLLNYVPNDVENLNEFKRQLYMDLILTGDCFQYFDGEYLYHLPSHLVTIETDRKKKVKLYKLTSGDKDIKFYPYEVIHTKDNSATSVINGESRLRSAKDSINSLGIMRDFQNKFFENGAITGLVITSPNVIGKKIKERTIAEWKRNYNSKRGAKSPFILDADMKLNPLSQVNFRELDFENSIDKKELKILKALGVPPILIESGNNANVSPNIRLLYYITVLPMAKKLIASYESFFGYDLEPEIIHIDALRPDMREQSAFLTSLTNGGIISVNEARQELRYPKSTEEHADRLIIPANVAGSATNPDTGGRPENDDNEDDNDDED